jgi:hypothetical protein
MLEMERQQHEGAAVRRLKVLALHSFRTSAAIFQLQASFCSAPTRPLHL